MKIPDLDLDSCFKRLHLANARRVWRALVARAEREDWSCRDFLALLLAEEIAHRQQTRLGRVARWPTFRFSRRSTTLTSPFKASCGCRCSALRCRPTLSPKVSRSF